MAALGALTVATQELDLWVGAFVSFLVDAPRDMDALTAPLQYRMKVRILDALVHSRTEELSTMRKRWDALEKRLNDAGEVRNHFVHSRWERDNETWEVFAAKRRQKTEPLVKPADKDTLYNLAREAEKLLDELEEFIRALGDASPDRPR